MSWPGPAYWPWAAELALLALGFVVLGEAVRRPLARWSVFLADPSPIARLLIDLYVGGGLLYLLVALPLGGFFEGTVPALLGIGGIALAVELARSPGPSRLPERFMAWIRCLGRPAPLIAVASALVLGLGELAIAFPIPTGNTFDSGVLTYFVSRLVGLHHIAYTYLPSTPFALAYPQGTTAWLGAYQSVYGLPPARTSLLVTPLFFALAPLGAYVVGERLIGRPSDGALLAIVFAFVGSWTRVLVGGSNDFVAAFPLVLLLFAGLSPWHGRTLLRWGDALSFGALAGVAASLNPAGPIWVLLTIAALAPFARPAFSGRPFPWIARWAAAVGIGALVAWPSVLAEVAGAGGLLHPGLPAGAAPIPASGSGVTLGQFVGLADPFLFRPTDVAFSPFPVVRAELAILLVLGAAILVIAGSGRAEAAHRYLGLGRAVAAGGVVAGLILLLGLAAHQGAESLGGPLGLTSLGETSILLTSLFTLVAAVPLGLAVDRGLSQGRPTGVEVPTPPSRPGPGDRGRSCRRPWIRWVALLSVALLIVPGAVTSATALPEYEHSLYRAFGNVTAADFDLFDWSELGLPNGARVLVAPGSAAEFVAGYAPQAVLLYPMQPAGVSINASYAILVADLTNGTLPASGVRGLSDLGVDFVLVTGASSTLFRPFLPAPLEVLPGWTVAFHEGDAYAFERTGRG